MTALEPTPSFVPFSEVLRHLVSRRAKRNGRRSLRVRIPIAHLAGSNFGRGLFDRPHDLVSVVAGKVKWTPAPSDALSVLGPGIERRRAEGATGEAFLFMRDHERHFRKEHVEYRWELAADALGLGLTWYQATRHSFASRNLSRGVPLDEVASALGHSTPAVTARHYAHFVRKTFSPLMTSPLGPGGEAAVIPIGGARALPAAVVRPAETEGENAA